MSADCTINRAFEYLENVQMGNNRFLSVDGSIDSIQSHDGTLVGQEDADTKEWRFPART